MATDLKEGWELIRPRKKWHFLQTWKPHYTKHLQIWLYNFIYYLNSYLLCNDKKVSSSSKLNLNNVIVTHTMLKMFKFPFNKRDRNFTITCKAKIFFWLTSQDVSSSTCKINFQFNSKLIYFIGSLMNWLPFFSKCKLLLFSGKKPGIPEKVIFSFFWWLLIVFAYFDALTHSLNYSLLFYSLWFHS